MDNEYIIDDGSFEDEILSDSDIKLDDNVFLINDDIIQTEHNIDNLFNNLTEDIDNVNKLIKL